MKERSEIILESIIRQYIQKAAPISSNSILDDCGLNVSSATVRNDVMRLEQEGFIVRPHYAAGSIPSDKGYRYFVEGLKDTELSPDDQFMINHLFYQVEDRLEEWLKLSTTVLAQRTHCVVVVTSPHVDSARIKQLQLVSIQPNVVLLVLVLHGSKVKQQLINCESEMDQCELTEISARLNEKFYSLSLEQLRSVEGLLEGFEEKVAKVAIHLMESENKKDSREAYFDGLGYLFEQPEFIHSSYMAKMIELAQQRRILETILPIIPYDYGVKVFIGDELKSSPIPNCSVIMSRYGLPNEPLGTIAVIGPTRMDYYKNISVTGYVASIISVLVTNLYGVRTDGKYLKGRMF